MALLWILNLSDGEHSLLDIAKTSALPFQEIVFASTPYYKPVCYKKTDNNKWEKPMKVVFFCGGLGSRLHEYTSTIPKPMVEIEGRPILWHLMMYYAHFGHTDFILCLGYKGEQIKAYFEANQNQMAQPWLDHYLCRYGC